MHVLVEYNDNLEKVFDELKRFDYVPVVLFELNYEDKNSFSKKLNDLKERKKQFDFTAVKVVLKKIDNSLVGSINNLKNDFDLVIGMGGLNKTNRFFLESTQVDFLMGPQNSLFKPKIDFIHHFNSGLNHVLCEYARSKGIGFVFSFNFFRADKRYIAKEIGRINQNLRFARKFSIPSYLNFVVSNVADVKSLVELKGIMSFFDLSTEQVEESFEVLKKKIEMNRYMKSGKYVAEGIEFE